jgi:hypothetical protein
MDSAQHSTHSSSSSAVELVVTSAGVGPSSPSLVPSGASDGRNSFARRRLSWGRVDSGQDPLRPDPDLFAMNDPGPSSRPSLSSQPAPSYAIDDDPFVSSTQIDMFRVSTATTDYGVEPFVYTNHPRAGASTASLISSERRESSTSTFDDSAHLTANMSSEPPAEAIGKLTQNTPLRRPHGRGVARNATVRSSPPSLALERPSNRSPKVSDASRSVLSTLLAPASKMKIMFAWGVTMVMSGSWKVMMME